MYSDWLRANSYSYTRKVKVKKEGAGKGQIFNNNMNFPSFEGIASIMCHSLKQATQPVFCLVVFLSLFFLCSPN